MPSVGSHQFEVELQAPYRLDATVWVLRRRAHNLMDSWDGAYYGRTLVIGGSPMRVRVRQLSGEGQARARLSVDLDSPGRDLGDQIIAQVRQILERMLGLKEDLSGFYEMAGPDGVMSAISQKFLGFRPPRFPSVFEAMINAVACQQLSLEVGIHLLNRLTLNYGDSIPGYRNEDRAFPSAEALRSADQADLRNLGFSRSKAGTIALLAGQVAAGEVDLEGLAKLDDREASAILTRFHGIGRWSTEYTLLRGLGRWNILPADDVGARNNLQRRFGLAADANYDTVGEFCRAWWPYGGIVYFHLLLDSLASRGLIATGSGPTFES
ncbi:DNA-3-methyladenine glycosylase 2 family protein [bacterium]|nr:MAG: DNA-3-methyladenine glycosylase 2 family protein [bacterium]